jgi:hypothetical protein
MLSRPEVAQMMITISARVHGSRVSLVIGLVLTWSSVAVCGEKRGQATKLPNSTGAFFSGARLR